MCAYKTLVLNENDYLDVCSMSPIHIPLISNNWNWNEKGLSMSNEHVWNISQKIFTYYKQETVSEYDFYTKQFYRPECFRRPKLGLFRLHKAFINVSKMGKRQSSIIPHVFFFYIDNTNPCFSGWIFWFLLLRIAQNHTNLSVRLVCA